MVCSAEMSLGLLFFLEGWQFLVWLGVSPGEDKLGTNVQDACPKAVHQHVPGTPPTMCHVHVSQSVFWYVGSALMPDADTNLFLLCSALSAPMPL